MNMVATTTYEEASTLSSVKCRYTTQLAHKPEPYRVKHLGLFHRNLSKKTSGN